MRGRSVPTNWNQTIDSVCHREEVVAENGLLVDIGAISELALLAFDMLHPLFPSHLVRGI